MNECQERTVVLAPRQIELLRRGLVLVEAETSDVDMCRDLRVMLGDFAPEPNPSAEKLLAEMVEIYHLRLDYDSAFPKTKAMKEALALALQKASDLEFDDIKDVLPHALCENWSGLDTHACMFARWMGIKGTEAWLPKDAEELKRRLNP